MTIEECIDISSWFRVLPDLDNQPRGVLTPGAGVGPEHFWTKSGAASIPD